MQKAPGPIGWGLSLPVIFIFTFTEVSHEGVN